MSPRRSYQVNDLGKIPTPQVQTLNNTKSKNLLPPLKIPNGRAQNKPSDLEIQFVKQGLQRIQIDGEGDREFLLDESGNIYTMKGGFYGTVEE